MTCTLELARQDSSPVLRLWVLARFLIVRGVTSDELQQLVAREEPTLGDCYDLYQCLATLIPLPASGEAMHPLTHVLFNVRYAAMLLYHLGLTAPAPLALLAVAEQRASQLGLASGAR